MLRAGRKVALIVLLAASPTSLPAATGERIVQDRYTGLALNGIDPVGYFTNGQAQKGLADFEMSQGGAIWRFRNAGNLEIFKARPDVYAPQFGGYDPVDVARGAPCPGNPQLWLIVNQRLYLFCHEDNRNAFAADPQTLLRDAGARWPTLMMTLVE